MIIIAEILFYLLSFLVINSFFLYPLILFIVSRRKNTVQGQKYYEPSVSIIIAAHNEEKVIEDRIKNIASINYDFSKLEVFIGSDNSSDRTNEILTEYEKQYSWLNIYLSEERRGKAGILNELIPKSKNEILVFTDANTEFQKDALKNLVKDFENQNVGGVCGKLVLIDDESSLSEGVEETKYWQYETFIKRAEGNCGILLAANGGIFAIKRELYQPIPIQKAVTDDLFISLSVVSQNYLFTYQENAIAFESIGKDLNAEYKRKVRFGATNFQTLVHFKNILSLAKPFRAYAFFSHKVTRWFLPFILSFIFILSWLVEGKVQMIHNLFLLQVAFYLLAFGGYLLSLIKVRVPIFSLPYFFVVSNIAIAEGFIKFLKKEHSVVWNATER